MVQTISHRFNTHFKRLSLSASVVIIIITRRLATTVKTLYNVTRYNRIFTIRYKIAGNGSVSIKIPSL